MRRNWLCQRANIRIREIANSAKYQMNDQFHNFLIFQAKFCFYKLKKFSKFVNFPMWKIAKISKILQFQKFLKFPNFKNRKISIIDNL